MSNEKQNNTINITIAIIGLIGTLGAALITAKLTNSESKSTPVMIERTSAIPKSTPTTSSSPIPKSTPTSTPTTSTSPILSPQNDYSWLSQREVKLKDLNEKTAWELDIMRNSIYARHGRGFNSLKLQNYFNQQSWYKKLYSPDDFPDNLLSSLEIKNAVEILNYQNSNNLRYVL